MMFYRRSILQFSNLVQIRLLVLGRLRIFKKVQAKYSFEKTSPSVGKMELFPYQQLVIWFTVISGILLQKPKNQLKSFLFEWCKLSSIKNWKLIIHMGKRVYWKGKVNILLTTVSPMAGCSLKNLSQKPPVQSKFIIF